MFSFVRNCQRASKVAAQGCIPTSTEQESLWFHIRTSILYCHCWWFLVNNPLSWSFHGCSASCCNQKTWIIQWPKVYFSFLWSSIVMWQVALLSSIIQRPRLRVALPSSVGHLSRSLFSWTFQAKRGKYAKEAQPPFKCFGLEVVGTNSAPLPCWKLVTWLCLAARSAGKCNRCLASGSWATT